MTHPLAVHFLDLVEAAEAMANLSEGSRQSIGIMHKNVLSMSLFVCVCLYWLCVSALIYWRRKNKQTVEQSNSEFN